MVVVVVVVVVTAGIETGGEDGGVSFSLFFRLCGGCFGCVWPIIRWPFASTIILIRP